MVVERIKEYLDFKGLSISAFERVVGMGVGTFMKAYKNGTALGSDKLENIFGKFSELNPQWVFTGNGNMVLGEEDYSVPIQKAIPLIPYTAFAGYGEVQFPDIPVEDYYTVSEFNQADFLIRIKGDSMIPKFNGGDVVACKKVTDALFFQWGRVYVIYTRSQGVMIKRVRPDDNPEYIKLVSENPNYEPFLVPKSDISDIALVLGAITLE